MIPYVLVVLCTILIARDTEVVDFCYPSLKIWIVGLAVFAIPSWMISVLFIRKHLNNSVPFSQEWFDVPNGVNTLSLILGLAFLGHLFLAYRSSSYAFGTDDFALYVCGSGFWAHVREASTPLLILLLYYINKKRLKFLPSILLLLIPHMVYMVKGPILIALITTVLLRLYAGQIHINLRLAASVLFVAFGLFLLFYMVLPSFGDSDVSVGQEQTMAVSKHFIHYLISGTLGYSIDYELGFPDMSELKYLAAPFVNIHNMLTGQELISPISDIYESTGLGLTNVRTFFGAIQIRTNPSEFVLVVLVISTLTNILRAICVTNRNLFFSMVTFYYCSLLAMGWFEYYFWHLSIIEIPIWVGLYHYFFGKKILNEQQS